MKSTKEASSQKQAGSVAFWLAVGKHWLQYTPHFFRHAPIRKWGTYLCSAAKVSYHCALWERMIERHDDVLARGAARSRLLRRLGRWSGKRQNDSSSPTGSPEAAHE